MMTKHMIRIRKPAVLAIRYRRSNIQNKTENS